MAAQQHRPTEFIGVESILTHESGEFVAERIVIPLTEEKGKSKVQSAGSTLTYLRRYSWASILGMYSDEDSDGVAGPPANAAFQPKPTPAGKLPVPTLPPPPEVRAARANSPSRCVSEWRGGKPLSPCRSSASHRTQAEQFPHLTRRRSVSVGSVRPGCFNPSRRNAPSRSTFHL